MREKGGGRWGEQESPAVNPKHFCLRTGSSSAIDRLVARQSKSDIRNLIFMHNSTLFAFSGLYQAHPGRLFKMIYWTLIMIGSHATVGAPRERGVFWAFGKMSGIDCRRFFHSPHPLPLLLISLAASVPSRVFRNACYAG